jgi:hypothetical protein
MSGSSHMRSLSGSHSITFSGLKSVWMISHSLSFHMMWRRGETVSARLLRKEHILSSSQLVTTVEEWLLSQKLNVLGTPR